MNYGATAVFHVKDEEIIDYTNGDNDIPVATAVYQEGIVIGYASALVEIYSQKADDKGSITYILLSTVRLNNENDTSEAVTTHTNKIVDSSLKKLNGIYTLPNSQVGTDLLVLYEKSIAKYMIPSGVLLAYQSLPLSPQGIRTKTTTGMGATSDIESSSCSILLWGNSCEILILDSSTLEIRRHIKALPDWPLVTLFSRDQFLVVYKGTGKTATIDLTCNGEYSQNLTNEKPITFAPFPEVAGDVIIAAKKISSRLWLVLYRNSWSFYRLEKIQKLSGNENRFVQEFSSGTTHPFTSIITSTDDNDYNGSSEESDDNEVNEELTQSSACFGALSYDGTVIWVSNGTIQLIEPLWQTSASVNVVHNSRSNQLIATVKESPSGPLLVYSADTMKQPLEWSCKPSIIRIGKVVRKGGYWPNDVHSAIHETDILMAYGDNLNVYTLDEFLITSPSKKVRLKGHKISALERIDPVPLTGSSTTLVVGSSKGRIFIIDKKSMEILFSLIVFEAGVKEIFRVSNNLVIAISLSSTIAVINPETGSVTHHIPGQGVAIKELSIELLESIDSTSTSIPSILSLHVVYENGTKRCWNLDSYSEIDHQKNGASSASSNRIELLPRISGKAGYYVSGPFLFVNLDRVLDVLCSQPFEQVSQVDQLKAIARSLISIHEKHAQKPWQKLLTSSTITLSSATTPYRVGMNDGSSYWTISSNPHAVLEIGSLASARIISLWATFARLLFLSILERHEVSTEDIVDWLFQIQPDSTRLISIDDFADLVMVSTGQLQMGSLVCLDALIQRENKDKIVKTWKSKCKYDKCVNVE